jgi:glycine cleavage system H protein
MASEQVVPYKRSRFSTRLPTNRLYTPSHFWMVETEPGTWRVGFTRFATRMLGDFVEQGFGVKQGDAVSVGQTIGWIEGFKAVTDLYCVVTGEFVGPNPALREDITLADTDPYGKGWLYEVRGTPESNSLDVQGYTEMLDLTIDKMQEEVSGGASATDDPACET